VDRDEVLHGFVSARGAALSRAAFLLTGDRQAAEDLVQETYVVLVRRWRGIDFGNPDPYVRRILYSRYVDGWRRRRLTEWLTGTPPETVGQVDESAGSVDRLVLRQALMHLTPRQRAVVVLRFYEDLTEAQAAEVLGVSVSTVKSQTRVALQRLREAAPATIAAQEPVEDGGVG
jgi:RNA polymerase sigma-70 factor (sigma-E family)